jgi:hypothetical protein
MKILLVFRNREGESWEIVENLRQGLEEMGHKIDLLSREDDLGVNSLSSSMGSLKEAVKKLDKEKNYDVIYTQDWSIAFPMLIPSRVFEDKHYCFFHNIEPKGQSKIFQKIVGNMMDEKLVVRNEKLGEMFPKSTISSMGIKKEWSEK